LHQEVCCLFHEEVMCNSTKIFYDVSVVVIVYGCVTPLWGDAGQLVYIPFFTLHWSRFITNVLSFPFRTRRRPSMNFQIEGWTTSSYLFRRRWAASAWSFVLPMSLIVSWHIHAPNLWRKECGVASTVVTSRSTDIIVFQQVHDGC